MHLITILAYVILFWHAEAPGELRLVREDDVLWTLLVVLLQPPILAAAAWLSSRHAHRLLVRQPGAPQAAQHFHHRATVWLRAATIAGFAAAVFLTRWPIWFTFSTPALQIVGDLVVLSPFVVGVLALWVAAYPLERALRAHAVSFAPHMGPEQTRRWRLRSYLDFNLRHHVFVVAVPMTLILFAANMTRGYEQSLRAWSGWTWTPDVLLGVVALGVFLLAPVTLTRIWRTMPLEAGQVRTRLEAVCRAIGLKCREILIWHSDGMMINAAVMGVFAPVRFVLLSDGLLATMDARQIEAVFGHEAGHVRHRHIQYLLVFAFVGWLLVAALMELLAQTAIDAEQARTSSGVTTQGIQVIGVVATVLYWGFGFGWLSRRFERQADVFGAQCVTPEPAECTLPCSVHPDRETVLAGKGRVCATGAARFTTALDRVALLNGIPYEERSWRHSSIASRIRFLASLAGDPGRGARFDRLIRRLKLLTLAVAIIGSALWLYYWLMIPQPVIVRLETGGL